MTALDPQKAVLGSPVNPNLEPVGSRGTGVKLFLRFLFCWHRFRVVDQGYVGWVIVECPKCGYRKAVEL